MYACISRRMNDPQYDPRSRETNPFLINLYAILFNIECLLDNAKVYYRRETNTVNRIIGVFRYYAELSGFDLIRHHDTMAATYGVLSSDGANRGRRVFVVSLGGKLVPIEWTYDTSFSGGEREFNGKSRLEIGEVVNGVADYKPVISYKDDTINELAWRLHRFGVSLLRSRVLNIFKRKPSDLVKPIGERILFDALIPNRKASIPDRKPHIHPIDESLVDLEALDDPDILDANFNEQILSARSRLAAFCNVMILPITLPVRNGVVFNLHDMIAKYLNGGDKYQTLTSLGIEINYLHWSQYSTQDDTVYVNQPLRKPKHSRTEDYISDDRRLLVNLDTGNASVDLYFGDIMGVTKILDIQLMLHLSMMPAYTTN